MTALKTFLCALVLAGSGGWTIFAAQAADGLPPQSSTTAPVTTTVLHNTESVLGKRLVGASGEIAGRIVDVLADQTGEVQAAIADVGGFLGVGSRRIAIAWSDLRFDPNGKGSAVAVDLTSDRLYAAPAVRRGEPVVVVSARRWGWRRASR